MYCPKCGAENLDEAKFCGKCGFVMPAPGSQAASYQPTPTYAAAPAPAPGQSVSQGLKVGISIASVFIPLIGIIMGIIFVVDANPEKKATGKLWLIVSGIMMVVWCMLFAAGGGGGY
jgi:uncharacterized membrane protein YvbJ